MVLMIRCILYPKCKLFVTSGGKEQAAGIMKEKVQEICTLIPAFNHEIDWSRGVTLEGKDYCKYVFKNGSYFDNIAARETSRGKRRHAGVIEECAGVDGTILSEVIIPTMNVSRLCMDGSTHPEEQLNKSQLYITTAGWKNSFAYEKLIEILISSILEPDLYMILGGTYETPVKEGLLDEDFVENLKLQGTYNDDSFDREYRSVWSGDAENAFFSAEKFDKCRVLNQPEKEFSGRSSKNAYYVIGVDVGRLGCSTEAIVIKVTPQIQGADIKSIVALYPMEAEDFEEQAIRLKKLYYLYHAQSLVIDANGLGVGLVDFMTKTQIDPETGDELRPFGVEGGTAENITEPYKKIRGSEVEEDAMYLIKANLPLNSEMHSYVQSQLINNKIKFLIDEQEAKAKLMQTKAGQQMDAQARNEYLKPFILTTILKEQMMNLVIKETDADANIKLVQSSRGINKDKFSALEYGMYYVKLQEELMRKKKKRNISDFLFFS